MRTYSELSQYKTFEERFKYLQLKGTVGEDTFGFDRWINQQFYRSVEWRRARDQIILRDDGCDLGDPDHPIKGRIIIHHMNPICLKDFDLNLEILLDPEQLICTSFNTHNAIHYGDENLLPKEWTPRTPNDTCPWKKG